MTTVIVTLPVGLAQRFTRAAEAQSLSREEFARLAIRLMVRAHEAYERTNQPTNQPTNAKRRPKR